jgi:general secretion pathway protein L
LALTAYDSSVTLELLNDRWSEVASERVSRANYSREVVARFLRSQGLRQKDVDTCVRLPSHVFFCRHWTVPVEAGKAITEIASQDLFRKTPFKPQDIHHDHVVVRSPGENKFGVWQWVVLRKSVDDALASLQVSLGALSFVVAETSAASARPSPVIRMVSGARIRNSRMRAVFIAVICSTLILAIGAAGSTYWRQQTTLDELDVEIATTRVKAQRVRDAIDKLRESQSRVAHLRHARGDIPGLTDMWDEVTKLLPSHTWLTELRIVDTGDRPEQQVTILGFSAAASGLVGVVDSSPLFFDTASTAPITLDPIEGRERFALQFKVKVRDLSKEATR